MSSGRRKLRSWISAFLEYTANVPSPEIFRRWAAYSSIAASLQRRVWTKTRDISVHPNLYVVLVGGPGSGKTVAIREASDLWERLPTGTINVGPSSTTRQRLYQLMSAASYSIARSTTELYIYHAMSFAAPELKVFMRSGELDFQSDLNDLFDNRSSFSHSIKGKGGEGEDDFIAYPWLNLLGGCTPKGLRDILSEQAFSDGFGARINIIYSDYEEYPDLFAPARKDPKLRDALVEDLLQIHALFGRFEFSPEARKALNTWYQTGLPPVPADPRLETYCRRRILHILKLCMIMSADERDDMLILPEHITHVRDVLVEAESCVSGALHYFGENQLARQVEVTLKTILTLFAQWRRTNGSALGVPLSRVKAALWREVDTRYIDQILKALRDSGKIVFSEAGSDALVRPVLPSEEGKDERKSPAASTPTLN